MVRRARARYKPAWMLIGAGEALLLAAVVALLFRLLAPLRRRLEAWFARRLAPRHRPARVGRVVVLQRRKDGTFMREDGNGG